MSFVFVRYSHAADLPTTGYIYFYLFWRERITKQRPNIKKNKVYGRWSTIASPYVHCRVDSTTFTMGNPMPESTLSLCQSRPYPYARVDLIPMPESTLSPSQGLWIWPLVYPPWTSQNIDNCFKCRLCWEGTVSCCPSCRR
jgi:hypothetical protein